MANYVVTKFGETEPAQVAAACRDTAWRTRRREGRLGVRADNPLRIPTLFMVCRAEKSMFDVCCDQVRVRDCSHVYLAPYQQQPRSLSTLDGRLPLHMHVMVEIVISEQKKRLCLGAKSAVA